MERTFVEKVEAILEEHHNATCDDQNCPEHKQDNPDEFDHNNHEWVR